MNEVIVAESTQTAAAPQSLVQLGTLQANTPTALVSGATQIADTLAEIIRKKKLANRIQGREYVRVEGWTTLGALLGVIAREESIAELEDGTYVATVSLVRMSDGAVVSRASAECGMDEPAWENRPKYARRSMALTRATGKAARLAFSWIMSLAGFEPTPAEEMPHDHGHTYDEVDENVVPSGKHKGKKWSEVSADYLAWAETAEQAPQALKQGARRELERRDLQRAANA